MTATTLSRPVRPYTEDGLRDALHALGAHATTVAETLTTHGHRGQRGCASRCPIARYLAHEFPDVVGVDVDTDIATLWLSGDPDGHHLGDCRVTVDMPLPVAVFVRRFDDPADMWYVDLDEDVPLPGATP
jgi:hypothetical protein